MLLISFPCFYPEAMSILDVKMCLLHVAEGWMLFYIHNNRWYLFIEELRPFVLRGISEQCSFIPVILLLLLLLVVVVYLCVSPFLNCWPGIDYLLCLLGCGLSFLYWSYHCGTFCRPGFVDISITNLLKFGFILEYLIFSIYCD